MWLSYSQTMSPEWKGSNINARELIKPDMEKSFLDKEFLISVQSFVVKSVQMDQGRMAAVHGVNEEELLKRRISCHPSYGFLVRNHLDCLKVGLGNIVNEIGRSHGMEDKGARQGLGMLNQTELDQFMEAYCVMLNKLKGAMEEPQQETMAFINSVYCQLEEIMHSQREEIVNSPSSPVSPLEEKAYDVKLREPDH